MEILIQAQGEQGADSLRQRPCQTPADHILRCPALPSGCTLRKASADDFVTKLFPAFHASTNSTGTLMSLGGDTDLYKLDSHQHESQTRSETFALTFSVHRIERTSPPGTQPSQAQLCLHCQLQPPGSPAHLSLHPPLHPGILGASFASLHTQACFSFAPPSPLKLFSWLGMAPLDCPRLIPTSSRKPTQSLWPQRLSLCSQPCCFRLSQYFLLICSCWNIFCLSCSWGQGQGQNCISICSFLRPGIVSAHSSCSVDGLLDSADNV